MIVNACANCGHQVQSHSKVSGECTVCACPQWKPWPAAPAPALAVNSQPPTERASVLRERSAAARARCHAMWSALESPTHAKEHISGQYIGDPCESCIGWAASIHPLPQRQTVRYEPDPHCEHRRWYVDGRSLVEQAFDDRGRWNIVSSACAPTFERIDLWQELRERPFTLVDDDGVQS